MNSSAAATVIRLVRESFRDTHLCNVFRPFSHAGVVKCTRRATARTMWIEPRTLPGFRLLQAKLFSGRQQCDRFANAPLARFQSFSCMNPDDEVTSVGGRQLAKEFPRF